MKATCVFVCLISVLLARVAGQSDLSQLPSFTAHPQSAILASGQTTNLTCSATSSSQLVTYSWLLNAVPIPEVTLPWLLVTMGANGEGAGVYSCLATNTIGTVTSRLAMVEQAVITQNFFSTSPTSPHEISVTQSQTAIISCGNYTSIPEASLDWEIYNETANLRINADTDKAIIGLDGRLYLQDASAINDVTYECITTNRDSGGVVNGYVRVRVQNTAATPSTPMLLSGPQDVVVNRGNDAFFECIVGGQPLATVEWMFPPGASAVTRLDQNNATLCVRNVQPNDEGEYICSAAGVGEFRANLSIAVSPVITTPLPTTTHEVVYGNTLSLLCGSNQPGSWQWFFQGVRLADQTGPVLEVPSSTLRDSGVYQCYITNSAGFDSSTSLVSVRTIPASITAPLPSLKVVFIDRSLQLECAADGAPPPSYIWTKESVPLASNSAFDLSSTGMLTISNVEESNGGNYTCMVSNQVDGVEVGRAATSTIIKAIAPTIITNEPGEIFKIQRGTTRVLACDVTSDPNAEITYSWTKDGQPLTLNNRITRPTSTGSLRLEAAVESDAGVYVCTVTTQLNNNMAPSVHTTPTNLTIIDMPVAPIILETTAPSPTSLRVSWHFPSGSDVLIHYTIELRRSPDEGWSPIKMQPASLTTETSLEGLTAYTEYSIRIIAVYNDGGSTISEPMNLTTPSDVPMGPPLEITAMALNSTSLLFTWMPPEQPNGPITDYWLQYRLLRDQGSIGYTTLSVGSGSAQTTTLGSLHPLERYEYRLAAATDAGLGPYSEPLVVDTVTSTMMEPPAGPFYIQIWFILLMVVVVIIVIAVVVIVVKYVVTHKASGSYSGSTLTHVNFKVTLETEGKVTTTTQTQPQDGNVSDHDYDYIYPENIKFIISSMIENEAYGDISSQKTAPQTTQSPAYGKTSALGRWTAEAMVHSTQEDSNPATKTYENPIEPRIREETYYDYVRNLDLAIRDPLTVRNPAYGDITTTLDDDQDYYINEGLGGAVNIHCMELDS